MKVIALVSDGYNPRYIVEVEHSELDAAFEKGYKNEIPKLKVGAELNLREIPDQRERIVQATKAMQDAYVKFVTAAPVMANLARVLIATDKPAEAVARAAGLPVDGSAA